MLKHVTESISGNSKDDRQVAAIHGELSFQSTIWSITKAKRSWLSIVSFFAENKKLVDVELGCKRTMCTYFILTGDLSHEEQLTNINVS